MKTPTLITLLTAALALPASLVLADSCNRGGVYCGSSLLRKGNYRNHIIQVLQQVGQPTDDAHVQDSIFDCLDGGNIRFRGYCANGCGGTDSTNPDYCF
ncbi:hypothetical protein K491DRAFT_589482 [Lophiostoma macrostomum CBS 122681]|uniref:Killer toxin Kp4 domain-containing protein n=1 Tax=Lophiostoma macrostomum CBS 122681 TaxID=1314788 RepID=A0A6A6TKN0_9PLEO|nr:hypothetical protein K491DRAFT_589482 [Lophiostoma macrostomum CBS 122681]